VKAIQSRPQIGRPTTLEFAALVQGSSAL
jgi:hypothetical protein